MLRPRVLLPLTCWVTTWLMSQELGLPVVEQFVTRPVTVNSGVATADSVPSVAVMASSVLRLPPGMQLTSDWPTVIEPERFPDAFTVAVPVVVPQLKLSVAVEPRFGSQLVPVTVTLLP